MKRKGASKSRKGPGMTYRKEGNITSPPEWKKEEGLRRMLRAVEDKRPTISLPSNGKKVLSCEKKVEDRECVTVGGKKGVGRSNWKEMFFSVFTLLRRKDRNRTQREKGRHVKDKGSGASSQENPGTIFRAWEGETVPGVLRGEKRSAG